MGNRSTLSALASTVLALNLAVTPAHAFTVPRFLHGVLDCARNTVAFLQANGVYVPQTASSRFFLHYRHISAHSARLGDVRFNFRKGGGHAQPVIGWRNGHLYCLNPSHRHGGWQTKVCPAGGTYVRVK